MVLGSGFIIAIIGLLTGWAILQARAEAHHTAEVATANLSQTLADSFLSAIGKIDLGLLAILDEISAQQNAATWDDQAIIAAIARQDAREPSVVGFRVLSADGKMRYAVSNIINRGVDVSQRDDFKTLRDTPGNGLLVTPPLFGQAAQQWLIGVARRVTNPDGSFGGAIYGAIPVASLIQAYGQIDLGPGGTVALYHTKFLLAARVPATVESNSKIGTMAISAQLRAIIASGIENTHYDYTSVVDGVRRTANVRKIPGQPYYILVGQSEDHYLADWRRTSSRFLLFAMAMMVLVLAAALVLNRRLVDWQRTAMALAESETKLRGLFELSPLGITRNNLDGRIVEFNQAFRDITGHDEGEPPGLPIHDALESTGRYGPIDTDYLRKDGSVIPVRLRGMLVGGPGHSQHIWSLVEDISERKRAEAETLLAASVFHNTAEAIVITDPDSRILSVNPAFSEITGYPASEVIGQTPRVLKSNHHEPEFYAAMWADLVARGQWQGQIWNRRKDGEAFLSWQTITSVRDDKGVVSHYVSVFNDMTEIHRKDEHIRHQAYHDALTGLPNRLLLHDRLGHAIEVARRERAAVAVMFIDLDHFKNVNDSLGHDVGDMLLMQITQILSNCLRKSDTIARLGGDEFVVVVSDFKGVGEVAELAEKIIRAVDQPMVLKSHEVHVGSSIGIAIFPQDGEDVTALMKGADTAMYRSKASGRNTFSFFDSTMDGAAVERLKLDAALRHALDDHQFELYYQPKIDLGTGALAGAEALIRWNHPERGLVPPDVFIPLAEENGLIVRIGDWVLEESCRQMAQWGRQSDRAIKVAINVSARQFLDNGFADKVAQALDRHQLDPSLLEIELTESAVMTNPERAIIELTQLRRLGVAVSLDDFGTGYSSLAYLKRLPLNTIKIDRSFVHHLDSETDNAAIVRAILGLGDALGMATIAEGVETLAEEQQLQDYGCATAQGYRYTKPLPADQFQAWVTAAAVA